MRLINRILQAAVAVSAAVLLFKIILIGYASLYPPTIAYLGWYGFVEFLKRGTIGRSRK